MNCCAAAISKSPVMERRLRPRSSAFVSAIDNLRQSDFLTALGDDELLRLQPHLELMPMPLGQVLCRHGAAFCHVYFPITSIVSMFFELADGACSEIAVVGKEGLVGVPVFMGGGSSPSRAVVLTAGYGYRIMAQFMLDEFNRAGSLQQLLLRYAQALMTQITQTAVCNRHHTLYQQLCRLLLLILDRQESNQMFLTHENIAAMLGTRREGVTNAAGKLQHDGIIRYNRGHIEVLDRRGLEQNSCECYRVVTKEYDRLLVPPIARQSVMRCGRLSIRSRQLARSIVGDD